MGYRTIVLCLRDFTITLIILIMPRLLNFIVAIYLIIIGMVGVFNL
jgi:hypothetical protein